MSAYNELLNNFAEEDQKKNRLVSSLSEAAVTNPDEFASMVKLSKAASVSLEALPSYKEEAEQAKYLGEVGLARLWKDAPKTSEFLTDPTSAKLAKDNIDNLTGIESAFQFMKNSGNALRSGIYGMNAGIVGAVQAPFDLAAPFVDPLSGRLFPENPLRRVSAGLAEYRQGIDATAKGYAPRGDGNIEQGWYSGLASLSRNLTTLPMAFLPGGQAAALTGMTLPVFGEEFGKARDKGLGPVNAATYGASQAAIEYATEKIPLSRLVGDVKAGEAFFKMLGRQAVAEVPGEQVATILQDLNEWAVLNPEKPFSAYLAERPDAAAQTLVATLVGVGGQTTVVKGIDSAIALVEGRKQRAEMSEQGTAFLEGLNKLAAADKLLARDPETFEAFVAQASEGGPVQQVFIDAKTLMQSGVAEQVAAVSPAVAAQLETAVATGGQIAIPIEEYTARIAPTEYAQGLLDHLKTEADGFSRAEAQEYMQSGAAQELEAEAQRILGEKEGDDAFKASAEVVRADIKQQLDTAARFTPQVNDAYSAMVGNFYAVTAAKLGTTPDDLFKRYPLTVRAESIAGGQQFDQGGTLDDLRQQLDSSGIKNAISEKGGIITLSKIVVPDGERGTGKGTAAMQALIDYADRTGQHIALSPSPDFGGNKKRLVEFYKRFGFVENKGKNRAFTTSETMYRQAAGKVLYQSTNEVARLVEQARLPGHANATVVIGEVPAWEVDAAKAAGFDISGYRHTADLYSIRHAIKQHGNQAKEEARGQVALTDEDFAALPDALMNPDQIILGTKNERGQNQVFSVKRLADGTLLVIEEVRTGRRALAVQSMRKLPGAKDAKDLIPSVLLNARNDAGIETIVVNSPTELNQAARGSFNPATLQITLLKNADLSTFLHESGHFFLEVQFDIAGRILQEAQALGADTNKPGEQQILSDTNALLQWFGVKDLAEWNNLDFEEKRSYHEQFARGFESYLFEGKAPSIEMQGLFQRFRAWMVSVYRELKNLNVELTDEVRGVFDRMLATNEQITLAEQGRSMMPLFTSPEQAGMTPEEFAAYQALGVDATNDAIQDLQARGLRDMQWIHNARGRIIKQLQREAKEQRAVVEMDVRREVMSQPIYRAWQMLTAKKTRDDMTASERARADYRDALSAWNAARNEIETEARKDAKKAAWEASEEGRKKYRKDGSLVKAQQKVLKREEKTIEDGVQKAIAEWEAKNRKPADPDARPKSSPDVVDETRDSLFVAIAKLGGINKEAAISAWGVDPADKPQSGVFGKPVWRIEGGLSLDGMAEALSQYGYLPLDKNGKWDLRDLEDKFRAELGGVVQLSTAYDYSADQQQDESIANPSALTAVRFDLQALSTMGLPTEVVNAIKARKMADKSGMHPDQVADIIIDADSNPVFSSGDELVRKLAAAESPKDAIDALTDMRMLEQFGDLSSPEAIERAADKAIHNETRARMIATEANALAKATGQRKVLASAAKYFAAAMIARLKVRNVKPGQYANAEVRAAKAAEKASKSGDVATAAAEKRNQLINAYATRAAHEAQAEVEAVRRQWSNLANRSDDKLKKSYDMDLVNAVRAILGEYGIAEKKAKRAVDYLETVKTQDPEMYGIVSASVDAAAQNAKPFKEMTVEEVRGLRDELDSILHLAKRVRQMEVDGDMIDRQEVEDALRERLVEIGVPDEMPGDKSAITEGEERMLKFRTALAALTRVESWVGRMDGMAAFGPFRRFIYAKIKDSADAYRSDKARYLKRYRDLFEAIAPTMRPGLIAAPELGYTFGKDSGGSAINEIVHAILHTGNDSNMRKLLLGRQWAREREDGSLDTSRWDAFIARMAAEGKITKAHFDFAQGVWNLLESTKLLAQKTHRDVFGKYFDEVTARPLATPFGNYIGGYVPAQADSRIVADANMRALAEAENQSMAFAFPATSKGFTKSRVEYNKPLLLDLRALAQHIDKVLLFSHMEMPVRDVQRVLSAVGGTLNRVDPAAISGLLTPWLNRAAKQQVTTPITADAGLSRFLTVARSRAGAAAMFGNLANAAQQITGFSLAALKVRPALMLSATADFAKGPRDFVAAVSEASPYMAERLSSEVAAMSDDINQILLNPSLLEKGQAWTMRHAYFLQSAVDNCMSPIIWTAAYNQAVEQGLDHKDAVRLGDSAVRETQGSTLPEDISRIEAGPAWARLFTQFAGYFNMQANLLGTEFAKVMQEYGLKKGAGKGLYIFTLGFMAPAVVAELVMQLFRGGPGDDDKDGEYLDDWLAALFFWAPIRNATAMLPGVGQMINSSVNAWNSKPYDDRIASSPAVSMVESAVKSPVSVYQAIANDGSPQKAVRDVATLISMSVGLPANLAARPIGYAAGMAGGRIDPTSGFDMARGLVTGVASPESKD